MLRSEGDVGLVGNYIFFGFCFYSRIEFWIEYVVLYVYFRFGSREIVLV